MSDPIAKAKQILGANNITDIPAEHLSELAEKEDIRVKFVPLPNDPQLGGQLLYKGKKKGIIINTLVDNKGKHNFTFAHELGHYFLEHQPSYRQDGNTGFWCSNDDLGESNRPREIEANKFAVELLMPEEQFRLAMIGAPLDFDLINSLSKTFIVSKHACSNRLLDFAREPLIIITSDGTTIKTQKASRAARRMQNSRLKYIPQDTFAFSVITHTASSWQRDFAECDPSKWFASFPRGLRLYTCTRGADGHYMTILRW